MGVPNSRGCQIPYDTGMASSDGDRSIPGWQSMYPGMVIDESRDGDQCIQGRRSMHPWMAIVHHWMASQHPGMAIDASRDGDRCIRGWRSMHHWMASQHPWMAIDASRDGDHVSRDQDGIKRSRPLLETIKRSRSFFGGDQRSRCPQSDSASTIFGSSYSLVSCPDLEPKYGHKTLSTPPFLP